LLFYDKKDKSAMIFELFSIFRVRDALPPTLKYIISRMTYTVLLCVLSVFAVSQATAEDVGSGGETLLSSHAAFAPKLSIGSYRYRSA